MAKMVNFILFTIKKINGFICTSNNNYTEYRADKYHTNTESIKFQEFICQKLPNMIFMDGWI